MGLTGRLEAAIEFKAGADTFHQLVAHKPHLVTETSREKVPKCNLHEGQFGQVGCTLLWNYVHDGKIRVAKSVVQKIEKEKKLVEYKLIEGDMMEKYKTFVITGHVQQSAKRPGLELVTWTFEYEKLHEDVEEPISFLAFLIDLTKEMEPHAHRVIQKP